MAVGAGGAFTGGVNRLPPVGLIDFSVGATGGVAGDVAGAFGCSLAHEAVKPTIVTIAAPPASAATLRALRPMISSYLRRPVPGVLKISLANGTLIQCFSCRT